MKSNMRSSNYKLLRFIRLEIRSIFSKLSLSYPTEKKFKEEVLKKVSIIALLKDLDPKLRDIILHLSYVDQTVTAKYKLNKLLGRKLHLFHVVFPSI
jgi:hypothetical protein